MSRRVGDEQALLGQVWRVWEQAREIWGERIPCGPPVVQFTYRGSTAGRAFYGRHRIVLNVQFMECHADDMLSETVPHEIAHLVAVQLYGQRGRGHGLLWRAVARQLGCKAERCHSYDLTGLAGVQRRWPYGCGCKSRVHRITTTRHNKARAGRKYRCRICRTSIYQLTETRAHLLAARDAE